jgi:phosphohistidine phosphatase
VTDAQRPVLPHVLYVLRHAKSSWDDPTLGDHERPLAPRGRRAAKALRRHLTQEGIRPALVLCSSAQRAQETHERVAPRGKLVVEEGLYGATADELTERLRELPERIPSVMLIGHNPALQEAILLLADAGSVAGERRSTDLDAIRHKFPTCSLATLAIAGRWKELGPGRARLEGLVRPADLD